MYQYISDNYSDLLNTSEDDEELKKYIINIASSNTLPDELSARQPTYILDERCITILMQELGPSKYNYISNVLATEFENIYAHLQQAGVLKYEVINLVSYCQPVFDAFDFSEENEDSRELLSAITGSVSEYHEEKKMSEMKGYELQQQAKA